MKNIHLIVGVSLPIILIAIVALAIYVPSLLIDPGYDFIYAVRESSYSPDDCPEAVYRVSEGSLIAQSPQFGRRFPDETLNEKWREECLANPRYPRLFYHSVGENMSREITLGEAQNYMLSDRAESPDGYTVGFRRGGGIFQEIFDGRRDNYLYIRGHGGSMKLNMHESINTRYYYYDYNNIVLGWVIDK